tara:strand:- start:3072 stop:3332 length:261 start_codon:yes stop_codon:yes gene_type:complete
LTALDVQRLYLIVDLYQVILENSRPKTPLNQWLSLWHKATLALHQDGLSMLFELLVAERLGACIIHNLATPSILAPHTVSVIAGIQ